MWTCKKCGNTEIMMREIENIERVGKVSDNGKMEYERYKKTNKSVVYYCPICGAESEDLYVMCNRSKDMYVVYWYDELIKLHKEFAKKFKECKTNKEKLNLYLDKEERLYGLILKSSNCLLKSTHKNFEVDVIRAIRNCQYRINKYRTYIKKDKSKTEEKIEYLTCLNICKGIEKNKLEMEEFQEKYKDMTLKEILMGIFDEIREDCLLRGYGLSVWTMFDGEVLDYVQIMKDSFVAFEKHLPSLRDLDNYHECKLEYVYREWYNFRSEIKKFFKEKDNNDKRKNKNKIWNNKSYRK